MMRFSLKIFLVFILLIQFSCEEGSGRSRTRIKEPEIIAPSKDAKVVFIFPAGAGAMRVSLGIAEKLQSDLELPDLTSIIDMAGGVSSGSLVAATVLRMPASSLKPQLEPLIQSVFAEENALINRLVRTFGLTLDELETVFLDLTKNPPNLKDKDTVEDSLRRSFENAAKVKFQIGNKIKNHGGLDALLDDLEKQKSFENMANADRTGALEKAILAILGKSTFNDSVNEKLMAISSIEDTRKPVFFARPDVADLVPGPLAVGATALHKALVASSAIPGFIKAPRDIMFFIAGQSAPQNIPNLIDGFFSDSIGFDPSAAFYDIFKKQFEGHDLILVYVGNGAPTNTAFRISHPLSSVGIHQSSENGKTITYVPLDASIRDSNGRNLFNLSGFYSHKEITNYMDRAAERAVNSPSYAWLKEVLQSML